MSRYNKNFFQKLKLPRCPHCGMRVNYFNAFFLKNKSMYYCEFCNNVLGVRLKSKLYKNIWISEAISLVIVLFYFLFANKKSLIAIFFVIIPFVIFYIFVPFFIELKKIKIIKKKKTENKEVDKNKIDMIDLNTKYNN